MIRSLTISAMTLGLAMGSAYAAGLRWNMTPSMPIGLWRVQPIQSTLHRGDVVTLCLDREVAAFGRSRGYLSRGECPGDTELLIKTVVALPDDQVAVTDDGVAVNGTRIRNSKPLPRDDRGRVLLAVMPGVYHVAPSQVWVISSFDFRSYDSRYYGAVSITGLRGQARPLFVAD